MAESKDDWIEATCRLCNEWGHADTDWSEHVPCGNWCDSHHCDDHVRRPGANPQHDICHCYLGNFNLCALLGLCAKGINEACTACSQWMLTDKYLRDHQILSSLRSSSWLAPSEPFRDWPRQWRSGSRRNSREPLERSNAWRHRIPWRTYHLAQMTSSRIRKWCTVPPGHSGPIQRTASGILRSCRSIRKGRWWWQSPY